MQVRVYLNTSALLFFNVNNYTQLHPYCISRENIYVIFQPHRILMRKVITSVLLFGVDNKIEFYLIKEQVGSQGNKMYAPYFLVMCLVNLTIFIFFILLLIKENLTLK